ncbi:protein PLASTID MOVEMENT IMPAIRED 2 isoform X2 [Mercurialis annua]|uniref:protein PLASTID MOVEMENT IMPAIRED 2 isoform X2 n=1 Tax=Mercurialis annua TaxID=3986 RepID=UPI00215F62B5|nr:protein PLASTID MOVEMENT IMPAIRED 2 isoform X2 [Mercurialis annua]
MDRRAFDDKRRIGTVKAAISMYGERILEGGSSFKQSHKDLSESSSRAKELHMEKNDMARYKESRNIAQSVKTEAESELSEAKSTVKNLASQIEESNSRVKARIRDVETVKKKSSKHEDEALDVESTESHHKYAEMMRELEFVKQELSKLKLDMASVLQEKSLAEKEIERSNSKSTRILNSVDELGKEIEEINEEHVLVELARIEALKEFEQIQAQREKEAIEFSFKMEQTRQNMEFANEEIDESKETDSKLAMTLSDVDILQNELKAVKEIEKKVLRNDSLKHSGSGGSSFRKGDKSEDLPSLSSITEELEAAKKELFSIREEGFQFMASMDIIRNELRHVTEETTQMKKKEEKSDLTVQNLKSKLLRANSKLGTATSAEEKTKSIVSNLSLTLDQLKTEAEAAKKEKDLITAETANIKAEIQKTESGIDTTEEKLQAAMLELEAVKESEASALHNLQNLIEKAMTTRASASQQTSSITISKFEYEYLKGRAVKAEEIADKKVAAAQAWVEALKASEKEILMKIEIAHREIKETRVEEEQQAYRIERSVSTKRQMQHKYTQAENWQRKTPRRSLKISNGNSTPRKSMKGNGNWTPTRRGKVRNSGSPAIRTTPGSTSFVIRKKKNVMPDLAKLFSGKKIGKNQ